ncbi:MAG: class I SAM-dependent methyltransferase [Verrucomicrobia bacterium]|nr:class I SAM-dependent methyltransferase [Verrucomicrobiota bacterium]
MAGLPKDFYERLKPGLYAKIGRELRLARHILDLGCGSCELVRYLAGKYDQEVTGIDVSSDHFPETRRAKEGVDFRCIQRDAARLDAVPDRSVDAVVTVWALHEMERPGRVLAESARVLRPGGELLVVDFPKDSLAQTLWDEAYREPDEVKDLLVAAGFARVRIRLIARRQVLWATGIRPADGPAREFT